MSALFYLSLTYMAVETTVFEQLINNDVLGLICISQKE